MSTLIRNIGALLIAGAALMPMRHAFADGSRWGANYFPNIALTTQDGKTVHFYDDLIKDKIVVINLIYTNCKDICPLETARLAQVQRLLGERVGTEIFFYSISIDPEHDTPEVLKAYAENYHAKPGWLFLTGNKAEIDSLSEKLGLYTDPDPDNRDGHRAFVLLGNEATGQWMRNSALDNPRFMSMMIGDWLTSWKNSKAVKSYAEVPAINYDKGHYLFQSECAACHTVGHGDSIGPDLKGVTSAREQAWLQRMIKTPDELLDGKDPIATELFEKYKHVRMPRIGLDPSEVDAVIAYLKSSGAT
jgi:protein SCO1/2